MEELLTRLQRVINDDNMHDEGHKLTLLISQFFDIKNTSYYCHYFCLHIFVMIMYIY